MLSSKVAKVLTGIAIAVRAAHDIVPRSIATQGGIGERKQEAKHDDPAEREPVPDFQSIIPGTTAGSSTRRIVPVKAENKLALSTIASLSPCNY
jgi:hypothetical protein